MQFLLIAEPVELGARVGLVSNYDKTVFFHFLITERFVHAKLRPPMDEKARSGLGAKMRMTASAPRKNVEERDEKCSCPAVSYGRVSADGG